MDDTIITGPLGAVQIVFNDGTTFALGSDARMTIDRLVYDPASTDNGLTATLLQGSFVFLTGAVAPATGDGLVINTPVGTMGIRGTFGGGGQLTPWSAWTITLFPEVDGTVSSIAFTNAAGTTVLDFPFEALVLPGFENLAEPKVLTIDEALQIFGAALNVNPDDLLKLPGPEEEIDETIDYETLNSGSGGFGRLDDLFRSNGLADALDPTALKFLALLRLLERGSLKDTKSTPPAPPFFDEDDPPPPDPTPPDDQQPVAFSIAGTSALSEGGTATYTVSYTGATLAPGASATVSVATGSGFTSTLDDAASGSDYTALSTVLTFVAGGATSQTVAVSTIDDTVVEGSEDYTVVLANPTNGTLATSQANTVIGDSDAVTFSIAGTSALSEGGTATYTVSYTGATLAPGEIATVSVATGSGFTGTLDDAASGSDYTALSTVLTFVAGGATSQTVAVSTIDDTVVEGSEDYTVVLANPTNGTLATSQVNTVIADSGVIDEGDAVTFSIAGTTALSEGGTATYTVSYTGATLAPGEIA
ncbi:MAG: Calx-beta domain-containing protein, partial [Dongiaceae bacterium]